MKLKKAIVALVLAASNIFAAMTFMPVAAAESSGDVIPDFDSIGSSMVLKEDFQSYRPYQKPNFPSESSDGIDNLEDGNKEYFIHGSKPTLRSTISTYAVNVEPNGNQYLEWKYGKENLFRESRLYMNLDSSELSALQGTAYVMEMSVKMGENFGNFVEYFYLFHCVAGSQWRILAVNKNGIIYQGDFSGGVTDTNRKVVGKLSADKWTRIAIAVDANGKGTVYINGVKTSAASVGGASAPTSIRPISMLKTVDREVDLCVDNCAVYKGTSIAPTKAASYKTPEPYIIGANLTLGSDIALNFYLPSATVEGLNNLKVTGIMCGEARELTLKGNRDIDGIDCRVYTYEDISPDMMVEKINVRISADGRKGSEISYSVGDYFHNILKQEGTKTYMEDDSKKLQAMCVEALNYGATMQSFNGYKEYLLVNHGVTVYQSKMVSADVPEIKNSMKISNAKDGVAWYGATLELKDAVKLKLYFSSPSVPTEPAIVKCRGISSMEISADSFERVNVGGQELYCVTFEAKNILNLCDDVTVTLGKSSITYGVKHCDDAAYSEVITALARYISAVKDYRDAVTK